MPNFKGGLLALNSSPSAGAAFPEMWQMREVPTLATLEVELQVSTLGVKQRTTGLT